MLREIGEQPQALARGAHVALVTDAGPELAVPATKTSTAQLLAVAVLVDALGPVGAPLGEELSRVPSTVAGLVAARNGVDDAVGLLAGSPHLLVAASQDPKLEPMLELARDLTQRDANVVATGGDHRLATAASSHLAGPELSEALAPPGLIVPGQLLVEAPPRAGGWTPTYPGGCPRSPGPTGADAGAAGVASALIGPRLGSSASCSLPRTADGPRHLPTGDGEPDGSCRVWRSWSHVARATSVSASVMGAGVALRQRHRRGLVDHEPADGRFRLTGHRAPAVPARCERRT